jgi:hypothetical protein
MRALCVVVLAGCSTGPAPVTMAVGPAGGQVSMGDAASVVIPQGALSANTPVSVSVTSAPAPTDTVAVGTPFLFGPEGTQFAQPVTITLAYDSTLLPLGDSASDVVIYTAPAGSTDYQPLDTAAADATHVKADTTHFSIFVAAAHKHVKDAGVGDDLSVAPVPDLAVPVLRDFAVVQDFAVAQDFAVVQDFAVAQDLTVARDLSEIDAGPCTPSFSGGQTSCSFTASCGGHSYMVQCVMFSFCTCYTDGVMGASSGNMGGTCASSNGAPAWNFLCHFP